MAKSKYYTRKDGLKERIVTLPNGKRKAFRGKTDREVDRKILAYQEKKEKGRSFPEVADEWEESREAEISESTRRVYSFAVKRLKEAFSQEISNITPLDIKRYIKRFETQGYSANTVGIELNVMRQICAWAVIQGDIDISPAAEVKKSRGLPVKKRNALTEEQEKAVMVCREGDWWMLGLLLLYTGCRRGEALALTWDDIDRKAGVVHITKKLNYAWGQVPHLEHHLKSENGRRDIPLLKPLADALPKNRIGLIFSGKYGDHMTASEVNTAWRQYCRDAGLTEWEYLDNGKSRETFPITPHCFRHSFATICFEAGVDPRSAAEWLGDTREVLEGVYQELRNGHRQTAISKLQEHVNRQVM